MHPRVLRVFVMKFLRTVNSRELTMPHRRLLLPLALLLAVACASGGASTAATSAGTAAAAPITSTEGLLSAMRARYEGKWYRTLTFVQASTYYKPDGTVDRVETWREAAMVPGRLRIDTDTAAGRGVVFANDSSYYFADGQLRRALPRPNELMVLGFDVYFVEPARMLAQLGRMGFDVTKFRRALHDGREYYVVGADAGDERTKQFWIEADRLLFWRAFLPLGRPDGVAQEIRFQDYRPHGGGWVAEEVDFLEAGKRVFFEKYSEVKVNVPLREALFDPKRFAETRFWWR